MALIEDDQQTCCEKSNGESLASGKLLESHKSRKSSIEHQPDHAWLTTTRKGKVEYDRIDTSYPSTNQSAIYPPVSTHLHQLWTILSYPRRWESELFKPTVGNRPICKSTNTNTQSKSRSQTMRPHRERQVVSLHDALTRWTIDNQASCDANGENPDSEKRPQL
jgi:hypothetical protein